MKNIIPKINQLKTDLGFKSITAASAITCPAPFLKAAEALNALLATPLGMPLPLKDNGDIRFMEDAALTKEAYEITVTQTEICIKASAFNGAFYAVQTLRQIMELDLKQPGEALKAPCMQAKDCPRFGWRGQNFDEARHFFGKDEVKRLLNLMAMHKLNVFHWHLTDDQGWRIEIKKYPRLTEIGSKRNDTAYGGWRQYKLEGKPHSGFYTQDDIREIVQYAADRAITVVPEIDMPAHFTAAFASYPWLACREIDVDVLHHFGGTGVDKAGLKGWNRSACIGKDTTFEFIFNVLDEIFELFPSDYIHVGGDEAPKEEWKKCPLCQKRMQEHGLANEKELQGYFTNRINEYVSRHGKHLMGWNEVLEAKGLDNTVLVEYWTPAKDGNVRKYLERGGKIISCKHQAFYFDMCYGKYPLKNTFNFETKVKDLIIDFPDQVLGVEGHLWTEFIADREKIDLNLFPRMEALAESGWADGKQKDYSEFKERLHNFQRILDKLGVNYALDQVAEVNNPIKRVYEDYMWLNKDQHRDVRKNRALKARMR